LDPEQVRDNVSKIEKQSSLLLDFGCEPVPIVLNNHDWIGRKSFIDWLRDVGKHFKLKSMIDKEFIQSRLTSQSGISYTEFSYITLQAFDFRHLFEQFGCTFQFGGNDQWGNITAGIDLIHRTNNAQVYGITHPLLLTATGEKFGKTGEDAIWLDHGKTTPWDFYQYLVRRPDQDTIPLLNLLTFMPENQIGRLADALRMDPEDRAAQKALAFDLTCRIHGREKAVEIAELSDTIYRSDLRGVSTDILEAAFANAPSIEISREKIESGVDIIDILVRGKLARGRGDARHLMGSGAVYVNNRRVDSPLRLLPQHMVSDSLIVLRKGKRNYLLVRVR